MGIRWDIRREGRSWDEGEFRSREMLVVFILTCLATAGFGWLLSGVPHPSAGIVSALLSGGVGIWASVAVRFLLSE